MGPRRGSPGAVAGEIARTQSTTGEPHMLSRKRTLRAGSLAFALVAIAASSASAHPVGSPVVGHAYVDDNTLVSNTVAAFDRHADGSLTPTPGSPFATGGVGSGAGLASQGAIQLSRDGRFL